MPAWGGAERLARLVGPGRALLLAGAGTVLSSAEAYRVGLIDLVLTRESFADGWRSLARSLATPSAVAIKRVTSGAASPDEAAQLFARLWVADEHWQAAERMMNRGSSQR